MISQGIKGGKAELLKFFKGADFMRVKLQIRH